MSGKGVSLRKQRMKAGLYGVKKIDPKEPAKPAKRLYVAVTRNTRLILKEL